MFLAWVLLSLPFILCHRCRRRLGPLLPIPHLPSQTHKAAGAAGGSLCPPLDPCPRGPQWFEFPASGTVCPKTTWEMGERKGEATAVQSAVGSSDAFPAALPSLLLSRCRLKGAGAQPRLSAWRLSCAGAVTRSETMPRCKRTLGGAAVR